MLIVDVYGRPQGGDVGGPATPPPCEKTPGLLTRLSSQVPLVGKTLEDILKWISNLLDETV